MLMKLLHHIHIAQIVKMSWKLEEWQNIKRIHSIKMNLKSHHKENQILETLWPPVRRKVNNIWFFNSVCGGGSLYETERGCSLQK